MSWKNRNQNNIIPFKKGVENKQKIEAEDRIKMIVGSIDVKMQQPYWDALAFDDQELQLLSNFGETIKFPHDNTAVKALSVLATYILKKEAIPLKTKIKTKNKQIQILLLQFWKNYFKEFF